MSNPSTENATKVAHVKAAKQTRGHTCHWPGCGQQVPPAMWGCKGHWFKLPKRLRDRIWATYRAGQETTMTPSDTYMQAATDVQKWIREYIATNGSSRVLNVAADADREMLGSDAAYFNGEIGNK